MGGTESLTKIAVLFARIVLVLWEGLSRIWTKLSPVRIKFNFAWLKVVNILYPIWRIFEPLYHRISGLGRKFEVLFQLSRKSSALFLGFVFVLLVAAMTSITSPLDLFSVSVIGRNMVILFFLLTLLMAIMGISYVAINEFDKSHHMFRMAGGGLIIPLMLSFIPPIAFGLPVVLLLMMIFGLIISTIAEGCLDPDAFDYSLYMGNVDKKPSEYHHTITEQDARYKQSAIALDRVVKKTRVGKGEEMEVISKGLEFDTVETEFETDEAMEFEPEEGLEFEPEEGFEFEPDEEMEFESEEEVDFEGEMEFESEEDEAIDFEPEGVIFGDEEDVRIQHDEDFALEDFDADTEKTVKDYEVGEKKKEMPEEEFDI